MPQFIISLALCFGLAFFTVSQSGCTSPTSQATEPPAVSMASATTKSAPKTALPKPIQSSFITVIAPAEVVKLLPQTQTQPMLLDFTSEYCGECKAIAPILSAAKKRYATKMGFMAIDVQKMMDAADTVLGRKLLVALRPMYTPTLVAIYPGGVIVAVETGFKTTPQLNAILESAIPKMKMIASTKKA